MNTDLCRELARIASVLHVISAHREDFTDLSDIKEVLRLQELLEDTISVSSSLGLTPSDPLDLIRQDWLRLVNWSNKVQAWIDTALDDINKAHQIRSKPSLTSLREISSILEQWPTVFIEGIQAYSQEIQELDWKLFYPYQELIQIVEAMSWLETPKSAGNLACPELNRLIKSIPSRFHPIVASRFATSPDNPVVNNLVSKFKKEYKKTLELVTVHSLHVDVLNEKIDDLLSKGQIASARTIFAELHPIFSDLEYRKAEEKISDCENQVKKITADYHEMISRLKEMAKNGKKIFLFPPFYQLGKARETIFEANNLLNKESSLLKDANKSILFLHQTLTKYVEEFSINVPARLLRWIKFVTPIWIAIFTFIFVSVISDADDRAETEGLAAESQLATEDLVAVEQLETKDLAAETQLVNEGSAAEDQVEFERIAARTWSELEEMIRVSGGVLPRTSKLAGQRVTTFEIGKHEVIWDVWQEVRTWAVANGYTDLEGIGAGSAGNHPVRQVSWYDVLKFCNAKSEKEGLSPVYSINGNVYRSGQRVPEMKVWRKGYRLPSEAEWEWAARGGASSQGYTYSGSNDANAVTWYKDNSNGMINLDGAGRGTWPVGMKAANELGLHDMTGNVWEWCWDEVSAARRIRGGSWISISRLCTVASRVSVRKPDVRVDNIGFRLARRSAD